MGAEEAKLLRELRTKIEDQCRRALLDAYLNKPDAESIADEALNILLKAINENKKA